MIYTVKTVVGRENLVADAIVAKAKAEGIILQTIIHPEEIKGYLFVEGDVKEVERAIQQLPHVRGLIKKPIELNQIQKYLQPKEVVVELDIGDLVEVIGGPFKNEKGKVTRHDKTKRECTIELLEVAVPIPVTVSVEFIRVLEKAKK
ncbi:MAG: transcription elongation factor Spt5 [Candidatus Aenigmarchaeota archaeon]|nr:transcription elongation factor Spt5 [Candidatus Aenigmarchaeota archaeon]